MLEPLTRRSVVDDLEARLSSEILDGVLGPGMILPPERDLAQRYGVTRTSLRQALGRMERAGLIETRQGSGSRVRALEQAAGAEILPLVTSDFRSGWLVEVFEARRFMGALVARRAAARRTAVQTAELRRLVDEIRLASSEVTAQLAAAEFHRVLAQATGNRVFVLLVNTLLRAYRPLRRRLRPAFADPGRTAALLDPIVEHVAGARPGAAERAALAYLVETEEQMLTLLRHSGLGPDS